MKALKIKFLIEKKVGLNLQQKEQKIQKNFFIKIL